MGLEIYQQIKTIKETNHKQIYLVYNEIDGLLYIHKILHQYNIHVFEKIKAIKSRHLPHIYEIIEQDSCLHIIEEYINAHTLDYYVVNNELDENQRHEIMNQLCDTIYLLHKQNIIHRDIKPENIFYQRGNAILFDFDISRFYQDHQEKDTRILGSVGYAAPEQFGFQQTDARTDIYAMGVLMNYLYTGNLPNEGLYDGEESHIIEKAIHIDPNRRYKDVLELKNDFNHRSFLEKINQDELSWTPPGFRSGKLKNKIMASVIYFLIILMAFSLDFEDSTTLFMKIADVLFMILDPAIIIIFLTNYRNVNNRYAFFRNNPHKSVRLIGIFLTFMFVEFLIVLALGLSAGVNL